MAASRKMMSTSIMPVAFPCPRLGHQGTPEKPANMRSAILMAPGTARGAARMYREMDMDAWLEKVHADLGA
jgi:hypothetical protein